MADAPGRDQEPALGGVPLSQYAAICAAIREGFALDRVLAIEGLIEGAWIEAETLWKIALVKEAAMFKRFEARLAEAEDRLSRQVAPLDADLEAWVAFLGKCANAPAAEVLGENGLGPNDLARLQRRWSARMKADASIAKQAAKIRAQKTPPSLPRLTCSPARLSASPAAIAKAAAIGEARLNPSDAAALAKARAMGIDDLSRMWAEIDDAGPADRAAICARFGFASAAAGEEVLRDLAKRMEKDDRLRADVRSLRAHFARRIEDRREAFRDEADRVSVAPEPALPPRAEPIAIAAIDDDLTLDVVAALGGAALPFLPASALAASERDAVPGEGVVDEETRDVSSTLIEMAPLPFGARLTENPSFAGDHDATIDVVPLLRDAEVMPFPEARRRAPIVPEKDLERTIDVDSLLLEAPTLPFADEEKSEEPAALIREGRSLDELTTLVWKPGEGDADPPSAATSGTIRIDAPHAPPKTKTPSAGVPELTIEQYASLRAELAVSKEDRRTLLARYGLANDKELERLNRQWLSRAVRDPAFVEKLRKLVESYVGYLERRR